VRLTFISPPDLTPEQRPLEQRRIAAFGRARLSNFSSPFKLTVELLDWATGGPEPDALRTVKAQHVRRDAA
jgi:hypothetical protein